MDRDTYECRIRTWVTNPQTGKKVSEWVNLRRKSQTAC